MGRKKIVFPTLASSLEAQTWALHGVARPANNGKDHASFRLGVHAVPRLPEQGVARHWRNRGIWGERRYQLRLACPCARFCPQRALPSGVLGPVLNPPW